MGLLNSSHFVYEIHKHPMFVINYELRRLFHAPITPSERHPERNQEVPGRPPRPGPPWNLLVSLRVSLRGSYGSLNVGCHKSS
jgi:hypothetical protein